MSTGVWVVSIISVAGVILIAAIVGLQTARLRRFEQSNIQASYRQRWGPTYDRLVESLGRRRAHQALHRTEIGPILRPPKNGPGGSNAPEDRS